MARALVPLTSASTIGFGAYRVSDGIPEHRAALEAALEAGCTLVDTAASYCDGRSEMVVGNVLAARPDLPALVITKLGYVPPALEPDLVQAGVDPSKIASISAESRHGFSPDVLAGLWAGSLRRLRVATVDAVLLHNPEVALGNASRVEFYKRIEEAFGYFESLVQAGEVRYYGVSSNRLGLVDTLGPVIALDQLLQAAARVSQSHHFRILQFPFNLLERDAAVQTATGTSLIKAARAAGLVTIGNRPLNALTGHGPCRLATYDTDVHEVDEAEAQRVCDAAIVLVDERLKAIESADRVMDFPIMQFIRDNWTGIDHPDTADVIVERHLHPFVRALWASDVPAKVRDVFGRLQLIARRHARARLDRQARQMLDALVREGLIQSNDPRNLATIACEYGLRSGLDHVLVGMRSRRYVAELQSVIQSTDPLDRLDTAAVGMRSADSRSKMHSGQEEGQP